MSPGLSAPKASPVSASHLAPSRAPRHSPHPRDLYSRIQGLLRPPSVSRTGAMSLIPAAHLSGNSACFPQNQRPKRGEMKTLLLQSLRASGDPAPSPAAPRPPLSCSSSCFVTQRWESKCGDHRSHLSQAENMGTSGVLTPSWGDAQLWEVCWGSEPPLLLSSMLCVWKGETPAALSWANLPPWAETAAPHLHHSHLCLCTWKMQPLLLLMAFLLPPGLGQVSDHPHS